MTIVLLIRHGLTDYVAANRCAGHTAGIHLNAEGKAQAEALAERLRTLPITAIYSSPIERAAETAQAIAGVKGLAVQTRPRLVETRTGEWTGLYYSDIQSKYAGVWSALQSHPKGTRIPGGETIDEVQERMVAEVDDLCRAHPSGTVAVVSHADPIKATICHYIGLDLDHFQQLSINPTSVSALAMADVGAALLVMNHAGNLPDFAPKHSARRFVQRIAWPQEGKTMPRTEYDLKSVSRLTASAVGLPGQRTFYIQARDSDRLYTLLCEKEQVAALAEGIEQFLEDLDKEHPDATPAAAIPDRDLELETPLEPLFRVGQMGLGYDQEANAVLLVATEIPESEDVDIDTLPIVRIWATRSQVRALSHHASVVVAAGRPLCPLCGEPIDPSGHVCPKRNGHKKVDVV
jgi:uncharacterized repeat protein (TIGR03847 family)